MTSLRSALRPLPILAVALASALLAQDPLDSPRPGRGPQPPAQPTFDPLPRSSDEDAILVSGSAPWADEVVLTTPMEELVVAPVAGRFSAVVNLDPNRDNPIVAVARRADLASAPAVTRVRHDSQPPRVLLEFPTDGTQVAGASVHVAGRIADPGLVGATVSVDGVAATVDPGDGTNGTFVAEGVDLSLGSNTLVITASDALGNTVEGTLTIERVPDPGAPRLVLDSTAVRQGTVGSWLGQPLVATLLAGNDAPLEDEVVEFSCSAGGGSLSADGTGPGARCLQVRTDALGAAGAFWTLGNEAGQGNQCVEIDSEEAQVPVFVCASVASDPAFKITIVGGDGQTGDPLSEAPEPLAVKVTDREGNPVGGVAVTFWPLHGKVHGAATAVVTTDAAGRAEVSYRFGRREDQDSVSTSIPGHAGPDFVLESLFRNDLTKTDVNLQGTVADPAHRALEGVTIVYRHPSGVTQTTQTDTTGFWELEDVPAPGFRVTVDGSTVTHVGGVPFTGSFATTTFDGLIGSPGASWTPAPIRHVELHESSDSALDYDGTSDLVLTLDGVPEFEIFVAAGSVYREDGTQPTPQDPVQLSVTLLPRDDAPNVAGEEKLIRWDVQPNGLVFDPGYRVAVPNAGGAGAGDVAWIVTDDDGSDPIRWPGRVSEGGSKVESLFGVPVSWPTGLAGPAAATTTVVVRTPDQVVQTTEYMPSVIQALQLAAVRCERQLDDTPFGYDSYVTCVGRLFEALGLVQATSVDLPNTQVSAGFPGTQELAERAGQKLRKLLAEAYGPGVSFGTTSAELLQVDHYKVVDEHPARIVHFKARLTASPPSTVLQVGHRVRLSGAEMAPLFDAVKHNRPQSWCAVEVTAVNGATYDVSGFVFLPEYVLDAQVTTGGRSRSVLVSNRYRIDDVGAADGDHVQATVVYRAAHRRLVVTTDTVPAVVGGKTALDMGLDADTSTPVAVDADPDLFEVSVSQEEHVAVTVTYSDGAMADATDQSDGTRYRSSNPDVVAVSSDGVVTASGGGEAIVTVEHMGLVGFVDVDVPVERVTTVEGQVVDFAGDPVNGATVVVQPGNVGGTTDAAGHFSISVAYGPESDGGLTVLASYQVGSQVAVDTTTVVPKPGKVSDCGTLILEAAYVWIGADGDWNDPGNWNTGVVPPPGAIVWMDVPEDATITVSSDASPSIVHCAETLEVTNGATLTAELVVIDETLRVEASGRIVDAAIYEGDDAAFCEFLDVAYLDDVELEIGCFVRPGATTFCSGDDLLLGDSLTIEAGQWNATVVFEQVERVVGPGGIRMTGGPALPSIAAPDGTDFQTSIEGHGRIGDVNSTFTLNASVTVTDPGLAIEGTAWTNRSAIHVQSTSVALRGDGWSNLGSIEADAANVTCDGSQFDVGALTATASIVEVDGTFPLDAIEGVQVDASSELRLTGTLTGAPVLDLSAFGGGLVVLFGGTIGGGELAGTQPLIVDGVSHTTGDFRVRPEARVDVQNGARLIATARCVVDGVIGLNSTSNQSFLITDQETGVEGTGTVSFDGPGAFHGVGGGSGAPFVIGPGVTVLCQRGSVGFQSTPGTIARGACVFEASGTVFLEGATFENDGGQVQVGPGCLCWSNAAYMQSDGSTVIQDGGTLRVQKGLAIGGGEVSTEGDGTIVGDVQNDSQLSLAVGVLPLNGTYAQDAAATLRVQAAGTTPGSEHGQLAVLLSGNLDGDVYLDLLTTVQDGDEFVIATFGQGYSGTFSNLSVPNLASGFSADLFYAADLVKVVIVQQ